MAEHRISIEGISPVNGAFPTTNASNSITNPIFVSQTVPAGVNFYTTNISDVPGVVAANNFLSILNPVGSGKTMIFYAFIIVPWATGATTATVSMNVFRSTAASAGTVVTAANIGKFLTTQPNSIADVRTGNPTVTTTGLSIGAFPPAVTAASSGSGPSTTINSPTGSSFTCMPGEGVVARTASGNVNQLWNIGFIWAEF